MKNYFKILTGVTIIVLAILVVFKPPVIFAQSDSDQLNVGVKVTREAFCNNNGICEPQGGEDFNSCPADCEIEDNGEGEVVGGGGYIPEKLYIKNLIINKVTFNSAEISWQTNKLAFCVTNIGKTSGYEKETEVEVERFSNHLVMLTGLNSFTTYHFNITCKDVDNLTVQSGDKYFVTTYIIRDVNNFTAVPGEKEIFLSWENPVDQNFQLVRLIRNEYFYPADINDGVVIYEGAGSAFTDENVQEERTYYYAIFAGGKNNVWSQGSLAFAKFKPVPASVTPGISTNKEITITIVNFSTEKINLSVGNNKTIEVLTNTPLIISANCGKIPGAEKVSVRLRSSITESSKNFCEASLISPRQPGIYPIEISITDSKNRVIGKIEAELKVLGSKKLFLTTGEMALWMYILITLTVIFLTIWGFKKKKNA